jgi:dimethylargininase
VLTYTWALTRAISGRLAEGERMGDRAPVDVALARDQHAAYVGALRGAGVNVVVLPELPGAPDGCFVEDTAVIAAGVAVLTRPGAQSRRVEVPSVGSALAPTVPTRTMSAPAALDGGDVLRIGVDLYVGLSARTNRAGVRRLWQVFEPRGLRVHAVELPPAVLHLKCVCSPVDDGTVLVAAGSLPAGTFGGARVIEVPVEETYAANAVVVNGCALVAAGHPVTRRRLEAEGLRVVELDMSETRKADGSLTCLSLLV